MKLLIDIGNSRIKICLFSGNEFWKVMEVDSTYEIKNSEFISSTKKCLLSASGNEEEWTHFLETEQIPYIIFNSKLNLPVNIKYKTPESLGNDRLAGVCGAKVLFPHKNVLVIDAGTAITYDILTGKGDYIGGNISPGLSMRYKSLNTFTKRLPLLNFRESVIEIGNSTEEAIHKGVQYGIIAEMFAYINEWKRKLKDLKIVITGGDACFFENSLKSNIFVVPNLVLFGLKSILELNE